MEETTLRGSAAVTTFLRLTSIKSSAFEMLYNSDELHLELHGLIPLRPVFLRQTDLSITASIRLNKHNMSHVYKACVLYFKPVKLVKPYSYSVL
jgi:hypothetical protein